MTRVVPSRALEALDFHALHRGSGLPYVDQIEASLAPARSEAVVEAVAPAAPRPPTMGDQLQGLLFGRHLPVVRTVASRVLATPEGRAVAAGLAAGTAAIIIPRV